MADNGGDSGEARVLRPLHAAAYASRIAFGPRAGQKVLTMQGAMSKDKDFQQTLCADTHGFSLHVVMRCGADDRQALEQLRLHVTRPALVNGRLQTHAAGQVVPKLKTAWRDGTAYRAPGHVAAGGHVTTNRWTALRHRVLRGLRQQMGRLPTNTATPD